MKILLLCLFIFFHKNMFSITSADLIASQIRKGIDNQEDKYISALISGIEARSQGVALSKEEKQIYSCNIEKKRKLQSQKNLQKAEKWIKSLQNKKKVRFLIPSKLAYSIVKKGNGKLLTEGYSKVLVNYSIKIIEDIFPETVEKNKELDLSEVIPGFAYGILSMQEGEIRTIYIHPSLAYQTHNFDPNVALEATVELLAIIPSSSFHIQIPPIQKIEIEKIDLEELEIKNAYVLGWQLWDHLRWGDKFFSKEDLIASLRKEPLKDLNSQYEKEINQIHWHIFQCIETSQNLPP